MELQTAARYRLLDELRGLDLISMMLYHGMWDVVFLFGVAQKWYTGRPGFVWQQSICWVFILLSGFCLPLGHHPFRRGAVVFGAGALVTAVTLLFLPEDVVWFGVLTLLGSSMLLTAALDPLLRRVPPAVGVAVSALLFWVTYPTMNGFWNLPGGRLALPQALYASYTTAYLGFMPKSFFSTDYFPLLPWKRPAEEGRSGGRGKAGRPASAAGQPPPAQRPPPSSCSNKPTRAGRTRSSISWHLSPFVLFLTSL